MLTREVEITLIDLSPDQARTDYDEDQLNELATSIARVGLINPITLIQDGDRYKLVAGSRRLRAAILLGRDHIQAIVVNKNQTDTLAVMAHENLFRSDLSPIEEGRFLLRLMQTQDYTKPQLAHLLNKSLPFIENRLVLLELDEETQEAVHTRALPIGHAIHLSQIDNPEVRKQYTQYAISSGASLRTIIYWIQQYETYKDTPPATDTLPTQVSTQGQLSAFGWHCFLCENFHEAPKVQTVHLCNPCYLELTKAIKQAPPNPP